MENTFIARQPIYDNDDQLIGYELLYRASAINVASFDDGKIASSQVILNSFLEIGFDSLVGSSSAFINITEDFILDESLIPMYEKHTVLEILEEIQPSKEVIAGVRRLKKLGYKIALDDFMYSPEYDELLELADYVKLDIIELGENRVIRELKKLRKLKNFNGKIIAEKVETPEMYDFCKQQNFDFYQGFYFCIPQVISHKNIPANKLVVLNLIKELNNPDFEFAEIEKAVAHDATLTYKLLRYVNSAAFGHRQEISTIKEALALVGGDTIRKWAMLILMMQLNEGKPEALLISALVRARMCESLEEDKAGEMFTIGLMSLLDALMDIPLVDLLDDLALSSPVKIALLDYKGKKGKILHNVIRYEQGGWDELIVDIDNVQPYFDAYIEAVEWADSTTAMLKLEN
ncbi:MAG: HDOD domain-containing protein [Gammaproteobacteria bacterium]|nr:HDOD domain-containing protein [Gammaproteobacteria bacterium]